MDTPNKGKVLQFKRTEVELSDAEYVKSFIEQLKSDVAVLLCVKNGDLHCFAPPSLVGYPLIGVLSAAVSAAIETSMGQAGPGCTKA